MARDTLSKPGSTIPCAVAAAYGRHGWVLLLVFIGLTAAIAIAGVHYLSKQHAAARRTAEEQLSAVADLKVGQLEQWYGENLAIAGHLRSSGLAAVAAREFLANPENAEAARNLRRWLQSLLDAYRFERVVVLDTNQEARLGMPDAETWAGPIARQRAAEALASRRIVVSDLHRSPVSGRNNIDLLVPLLTVEGEPVAVLMIEMLPDRFLEPFIRAWPTPSQTAETLLVRQEGKELVYLTELRHRTNTALNLRLPLEGNETPAAHALRGQTGIVHAPDYRGVPVLAATRRVPNTPWVLITKVDQAEVDGPERRQAWTVGLVVAALILAAGLAMALTWRHLQTAQLQHELDLERKSQELSRQAEEALRASEERYRTLVNSTKDILYSVCTDGKVAFVGTQVQAYGYSDAEMVGRAFADFIVPDDLPAVLHAFQHTLSTGQEAGGTFRLLGKDGRVHWFEEIGRPVRDPAGRIVAISGILRDVTARKQMEEELDRERDFSRTLVRSSPAYLFAAGMDGRIRTMNESMLGALGYTADEMVGRDFAAACVPERERARFTAMHELIRTSTQPTQGEGHVLTKDGRELLVEWHGGCICRNGTPDYVLGVGIDITDRKRLEAQLRQAQKLEAVGQLAGGVAHDFNNILAAIMMHLGLLQMNPALDEETRQGLKELDAEARRAASLTRQLLMFSRRSVLAVKPLALNEVVDDMLKMLRRLIGEHIHLRFDGTTRLPLVKADAGMLEQVVMNLVVNARDAMPQGGRITLSTSLAEVHGADAATHPDRRTGRFVCLTVSDTGAGMDEATLKRIFEPFFTTKEVGKGTGLGLATVHGIVAQHKGWVEVESRVGHGTAFRVFLPALVQAVLPPAPVPAAEPLLRGQETILLVEDDAQVRRTIAHMLRTLGYQVHEAANGQEAMTLWQTHGAQVDLLFTDMVMPEGITGLELTERLQRVNPSLRVIISSGYSAEIAQAGVPDMSGVVYLPKPYEATALADAVRNCLKKA